VSNSASHTLTKLRAFDGTLLDTRLVGSYPFGLAFDGAEIWVADFGTVRVWKF
jgi:hypothetical protein